MKFYLEILCFIKANLEKQVTLENDMLLLAGGEGVPTIDWGMRMAVVYRSENKRIVRA